MGEGVVHYLVLSRSLMKNVINFKVLPPNFDSKHTPINATFKSPFVKFRKEKVLNHPKTYKWDNQGAVLFHSLLNQKEFQEKLGKLRFDLESSSNTNAIQKTVKQITEIISECGDKILRIKRRGKENKKPQKPWYSDNRILLRRLIQFFNRMTKLLQKDPKNPYVMGKYQKIKNSYKHMIKVSKRQWEINNIQKLSELTENIKFSWSHSKSLRGATKSSTSNVIAPQQRVKRFSKLLHSENEGKDDQKPFLYNDADGNIRNTIFNSPFTSEGIVKGTTFLKSKKASGHNSISNEMIEASLPSSLSFLVTLFSKILETQICPEEWSRGIITPEPKSRKI